MLRRGAQKRREYLQLGSTISFLLVIELLIYGQIVGVRVLISPIACFPLVYWQPKNSLSSPKIDQQRIEGGYAK
jgi:hypothetical protein